MFRRVLLEERDLGLVPSTFFFCTAGLDLDRLLDISVIFMRVFELLALRFRFFKMKEDDLALFLVSILLLCSLPKRVRSYCNREFAAS